MPAPSGFVYITATKIQNAAGALLSTGTLEVLPTDGNNLPISAAAGGAGGPITTVPATLFIAAGVLQPGAVIADTTMTLPANISYRLTFKDHRGVTLSVLRGVQNLANTTLNLDTYQPIVPGQAVIQAGAQGPPGPPGPPGTGGAGTTTPVTAVSTSGSALTLAFATSGDIAYDVTLSANCAISITAPSSGAALRHITLWIHPAGFQATLPASSSALAWAGGSAPVPSTSGVTRIAFENNGSTLTLGGY